MKKNNEFVEVDGTFEEATSNALVVADSKEIVTYDESGNKFIVELTSSRKTSLCTLASETPAEKAVLFKIMNNPEQRLADHIGEVIEVTDLFVEVIQLESEETGEMMDCPRIVVIDKDKVGYQCVSVGVWSAFKKLISIYGVPTWKEPIKLKVRQIQKGKRSLLTFDIMA